MHDLYNLKEMLCEELANYGKTKDLSLSTLEIIDKLAHATKNVEKIIESYEEQAYSGRSYDGFGGSERSRRSMRGSYADSYLDGGMSGRRGRAANGRFISRDGSEMARELRELMLEAPDEHLKSEIRRLAEKIETM